MQKRILVVEDAAIVARDIRNALVDLGYHVTATVASCDAALASVGSEVPDLVLMDIHIQGDADGIETAAKIRAMHDLPVVYVTSYSDDVTVQRAKAIGAYGYVLKPFTDRELRIAIEIGLQKHEIERLLSERERWFSTTLNSISDAVIAVDERGMITFMNPASELLLGVFAIAALGQPITPSFELFLPGAATQMDAEAIPINRALAGETVRQAVVVIRAPGAPDGHWHSINATPVRDPNGAVQGAVMVSRDITELRHAMDRLEQAALRDELTGLLNRRGFHDQATGALSFAQRTQQPVALIYIDLNGMKTINDMFGHAVGDRALVDTADLMRRTFRASDLLARLGGDEFAVLATHYTEEDGGASVHRRFREHLELARRASDRVFELSASLGVTVYDPRKGTWTMEQLLADADAKMYEAKERRKIDGTQRVAKIKF